MMLGAGHGPLIGSGLFGGLGMVTPMMFMLIVPVLLLIWLASSTWHATPSGCGPAQPVAYDPALAIVRERYARGEIDKATYERLVAELFGRS